jgi:uncharacterized protein
MAEPMQLSRYLKIYPCPDQPGRNLLYSTKRSAAVLLDDGLLAAARQGTLGGPERDTLVRLGFLVADPAAEQEELRNLFLTANQLRRVFSAIVVLNLDCNLACSYCYEDRFRGRHYMAAATADLLVETICREQIAQGRDVTLSFYGGEPLLSPGLIRDISLRLQTAAAAQGVRYEFNLVTNGTLLTRSLATELVPLGLSGAKFTLDGPQPTHDRSRPFVSGQGSFAAIVDNIKAVWDLVPLQLGGNFTRANYPEFPRLLDQLLDEGVSPDRLRLVFFTPVIPKAGSTAAQDFHAGCACDYEPWLIEAGLWLREETLRRGYPAPKPKLSACMVELASDLVINYDGSLYKCPAFMAYDSLRVGTLTTGIGDYRVSHNLDVWKTAECLDCPYLPLCFGGCRQLTLLRQGAIDSVDCRREYYDTALERIVRQDLQYQATKKL